MSFISIQIAKMMAGTNNKMMHGEVIGNIDPLMEWIKWLSYIPDFQRKRIEELENKISDLSLSELDELKEYLNQQRMLGLFKIYGTEQISREGYMEVYNYMLKESIDDLMLSKLSQEELEQAKEIISKCSLLPQKELNLKVMEERKKDAYISLSMLDSYVLHIISRVNFSRSMKKSNEELKASIERNDVMRQKSYYYASNPYLKK